MHTSTMISALRNVEKRPTRPVCDYPPPARSPALLETTPEPARAGGCTIGIVSNLRGCNARGVNILYPRRGYFRCVSTYRLLIPFVRLVLSAVSDRSTINRPSSHSKIIRKDLSRAKSEDHWGRRSREEETCGSDRRRFCSSAPFRSRRRRKSASVKRVPTTNCSGNMASGDRIESVVIKRWKRITGRRTRGSRAYVSTRCPTRITTRRGSPPAESATTSSKSSSGRSTREGFSTASSFTDGPP